MIQGLARDDGKIYIVYLYENRRSVIVYENLNAYNNKIVMAYFTDLIYNQTEYARPGQRLILL